MTESCMLFDWADQQTYEHTITSMMESSCAASCQHNNLMLAA